MEIDQIFKIENDAHYFYSAGCSRALKPAGQKMPETKWFGKHQDGGSL